MQINVASSTAALQIEISDLKAKCKKLEDEVLALQKKMMTLNITQGGCAFAYPVLLKLKERMQTK